MSVLDRSALEASPLADLHAIASELGIDGFRRLRREALIDAVLERQGGGGEAQPESAPEVEAAAGETGGEAESGEEAETPARRRRRRGGRRRRAGGGDGDGDG